MVLCIERYSFTPFNSYILYFQACQSILVYNNEMQVVLDTQLLNYQERAIICSRQWTTLFYVAYNDLFCKYRMRLDTKIYS